MQGRHFFEAVIRENLDLGRPDRVRLLFPLRITRATPPPAFGYRTRVITDGVEPSLHVEYKSSHVKQYFKEVLIHPRGSYSLSLQDELAEWLQLL